MSSFDTPKIDTAKKSPLSQKGVPVATGGGFAQKKFRRAGGFAPRNRNTGVADALSRAYFAE
jgi:hypothetical protein